MLIEIVIVFIIVWIIVQKWERRELIHLANMFDGPKLWCLPIIGHSYILFGNDEDRMVAIQNMGREAMKLKGGIMSFWQCQKLYLGITEPISAEYLLKNCLEKDDVMKCSRQTTGNGSVFAPVHIWRPRRKMLAPTFNPKNLMEFGMIFSRLSTILVDQLKSAVGTKDFSIWDFINTYSMNTVCESILGVRVDAQNQDEKPFLKTVEQLVSLDSSRMCQPWLYNDTVYKMTPFYQRHKKLKNILYGFIDEIIEGKRKLLREEKAAKTESDQDLPREGIRSFLELLIESSGGDKGYTNLELQEETVVLVIAGTDTTAVGISFTTVLLSKHLDVQEKIYQELQEVFGNSKRAVVPEDLPRLKYLDAVIKESLRLYPPVPIIVRKVVNEVTLPSGETLVPGTGLIIHIWAINRNPQHWGDDADQFRPERFIDTPPKHPAAFMSFSYGPRACLGYQYAIMSMKTAMANLLRHYQILPASTAGSKDEPLRVTFNVMMKSVDQFMVQLKYRT